MSSAHDFFRNRIHQIRDPSHRTPDRETTLNNADNIERQLQQDNHQIWGFVIYRCTYESETEWAEFMDRLNFYIEETLRFDNALDMKSSLDYRVFEDVERLDKAHPSAIREIFSQWAETAPQREQGAGKFAMRSQRYDYCLHVDQEALVSVIRGPAPPADNWGGGFVNLVCKRVWGGMRPEYTEGREERDACWIRISCRGLIATWYNLFRPQGSWGNEYRVPPEVARP
jgi:hypothetical protein